MTEPRGLTDTELLAWSVVLAWRDQLRGRGNEFILPPYPPCPTCGEDAHEIETYRTSDRFEMSLTINPCGHAHVVADSQMDRIHTHAAEMIHSIDVDERLEFGKHWTTDDVIREAQARLSGDGRTGPVVGHATIGVHVEAAAEAAAAADPFPDVAGCCPACGGESLMLADGGYITCRRLDCPNPEAAHQAIEERAGANAYDRAVNTPPSAAALETIRQRLADGTAPRRRVRRADHPPVAGYCPACGRGDLAPTADQYELQRQRADTAEAALKRVRDLANRIALDSPWGRDTARQIRLAVQPPTPDGPTVAEAKAADRNWDVEQEGE